MAGKKYLLLLVTLLTAGCLTDEQKIAQLEQEGKLPILDRSEDLAGPDENDNGIRDDVDTYIDKEFKPYLDQGIITQKQFNAIEQVARGFQVAVTTYIPEDDQALAKANAMASDKIFSKANDCLVYRFWYEHPELETKQTNQIKKDTFYRLRAVTMNTEQRVKHYLSQDKYFDGEVFSASSSEQRRKGCDDE